jgi:hypothetical protein
MSITKDNIIAGLKADMANYTIEKDPQLKAIKFANLNMKINVIKSKLVDIQNDPNKKLRFEKFQLLIDSHNQMQLINEEPPCNPMQEQELINEEPQCKSTEKVIPEQQLITINEPAPLITIDEPNPFITINKPKQIIQSLPMGSLVSPKILSDQIANLKRVSPVKVIDNYQQEPTTLTANTNPVFFDHQKLMFTQIKSDVSLLDAIKSDLSNKYKTNKDTIKVLLPDQSLELLKNDSTFADGPFIVTINNNLYDVYEKVTNIKVVERYFYNSEYKTNDLIYVGKYGSLFF